jgi:hypothetical protein
MSDWQLHVPHHSRSDNLLVVVPSLAYQLEKQEDRDTARWLAVSAYQDMGLRTAGQLIDHLESITEAERRELLDKVRAECGLPSTKAVDELRRAEAATAAGVKRAAANSGWQLCHAGGCNAIPMSNLGVPIATEVRRWFCPAHRDQAQPGDMEPRGSGLKISPSGAIVPDDDPAEHMRDLERERSRRNQLEAQAADREVEAEKRARYKQALDDDLRAHTPPGVLP